MDGYKTFNEALELIERETSGLAPVTLPIANVLGRVLAEDCLSQVNLPPSPTSLKDGFAVQAADLAAGAGNGDVLLRLVGNSAAGDPYQGKLSAGQVVRTLTGAVVPDGADAIVQSEDCLQREDGRVAFFVPAAPGKDILAPGADCPRGTCMASKDSTLTPGLIGSLSAVGFARLTVVSSPRVAIIACGDELQAPGETLRPGGVYGSNLVTLGAWLDTFGIEHQRTTVRDHRSAIVQAVGDVLSDVDLVVTCGGAWNSERDLTRGSLNELGWREVFGKVEMNPGKGTAFGLCGDTPVFCLPGTPSACEIAFLKLALPAIRRLGGHTRSPFMRIIARLGGDYRNRRMDWTRFQRVQVRQKDGVWTADLPPKQGRTLAQAQSNAILWIPAGTDTLRAESEVEVELLEVPQ